MSGLRLVILIFPMVVAVAVASCRSTGAGSPRGPRCSAQPLQQPGPTLVAGSVFVLQKSGGNVVFSVGRDGVFVVDARSVEAVAEVLAFSSSKLGGPATLRYIVSTHSHRDHTLGNVAATKDTVVLAHARTAARLRAAQTFQGRAVPAAPREEWPTRTFDDRVTLTLNGETIEVLHVPGAHTDGDAVVLFKGSGVAALGDAFFHDHFPYVDRENGGSLGALERAIAELLRTLPPETRIVGGHFAPVSCLADLRRYGDMLRATRRWADDSIRAGRRRAELEAEGVPPPYRTWEWGVVPESLWIETLVDAHETP